jgi:putative ABC transport system ATP-binding protein
MFLLVKAAERADIEAVRHRLKPRAAARQRRAYLGRIQLDDPWLLLDVHDRSRHRRPPAAALGLVVGIVVVAQTIYATTMDHSEGYGTPRPWARPTLPVSRDHRTGRCSHHGYLLAMIVCYFVVNGSRNGAAAILVPMVMVVGMFGVTVVTAWPRPWCRSTRSPASILRRYSRNELMNRALQARGLRKVYAQAEAAMVAIEHVDLDIYRGEVTLLMGPSGSGKTTLLSILGGLLRPSAGTVSMDGQSLAELGDRELSRFRLQNIGFVFQAFNLFPTLSAVQNVELAFDLRGIRGSAARKQANDLLDQVGLSSRRDSHPVELSGGQRQRVAIARALAGRPTILLADEPTAALDSTSGHSVMELMQRLARESARAVVIVTHDSRMESYAQRIVGMADGRITSDERPLASHLEGVSA